MLVQISKTLKHCDKNDIHETPHPVAQEIISDLGDSAGFTNNTLNKCPLHTHQIMDGLQAAVTSVAVIAIVLLMVLMVCQKLGPKATAWVCSNREEKIGLSKNKLFNANGYLIHSGSDILLSSTGSFKRFECIDHDYKELGQTSMTSPTWNLPAPDIPPQPLRPAPAPSTKERKKSIEKTLKQQSCDGFIATSSASSTIIPRPIARRQLSSPAGSMMPINLSQAAAEISNGPRSCTNPFLNGSISIPEGDCSSDDAFEPSASQQSATASKINVIYTVEQEKNMQQNPFFPNDHIETSRIDDTNQFQFHQLSTQIADSTNLEDAKRQQEPLSTRINSITNNLENVADKFFDSPYADAFDNIESILKTQFRNRSRSETEIIETPDPRKYAQRVDSAGNYNRENNSVAKAGNSDGTCSTNPFSSNLHKTLSETYLEQLSTNNRNYRSASQTWQFGRALTRQGSNMSLTRSLGSSQNSIVSDGCADVDLKRAMSCDSVNSESSVILADLEPPVQPVTGLLCVGLQYDKNTQTDEGVELIVTVMEAKELIGPANCCDTFDTFVRIYLVPDETGALQTKLFKNSKCPSYNETFCFWLSKKRPRRSLWFHLYHSGNAHTLLGEAEMQIGDVSRPITTWLSLSDSKHNINVWGELMFSISYLPTAERLTVVVVKARNLKFPEDSAANSSLQNVFVKVYLLKNDKKVSKKKTSVKRNDACPIYNESMIFSIPPHMMHSIQLRLTVVNVAETSPDYGSARPITVPMGHVIVGSNASGKGLRHWNQMLMSLRKPIAMWHAVRKTSTTNSNSKYEMR